MKQVVGSSDNPSSSKGNPSAKASKSTNKKNITLSGLREGQHTGKCVIYKCNHCSYWTIHPHLTKIHEKEHADNSERHSLMDIDDETSSSAYKAKAIQPLPEEPLSKTNEPENSQGKPERLVFYKCEFCPYFTMQKDQMDEHLDNPPSNCEKSRSEKEMQEQDKSAKLLDQEKSRREALKRRTAYQTTRIKTIKKEASASRKKSMTAKSDLIGKDMKGNKEEEKTHGERYGLRECPVLLDDIYASNKKTPFTSAQGSDPEEEEKMTLSFSSPAPLMITELLTEDGAPSYFDVEDVVSGLNDLQVKVSELIRKKETLQLDLDSLQFDYIEAALCDPETNQVNDQNKLDSIGEEIRSLKDQLRELEEELVSYREIEESLTCDLKQAGF